MADTGAVVDIVGLESHTCPLLHDVAVLIRGAARNLEAKGSRPELVRGLLEFARDKAKGFIPRSFHELVILLDQRLCQPIRAMDRFPAGSALGTKLSFVHRAAFIGLDTHYFPIVDDKIQAAANTTIGACRRDILYLWYFTQTH
jgi:hypothetical protein